jgi:5'-3' exonuclease
MEREMGIPKLSQLLRDIISSLPPATTARFIKGPVTLGSLPPGILILDSSILFFRYSYASSNGGTAEVAARTSLLESIRGASGDTKLGLERELDEMDRKYSSRYNASCMRGFSAILQEAERAGMKTIVVVDLPETGGAVCGKITEAIACLSSRHSHKRGSGGSVGACDGDTASARAELSPLPAEKSLETHETYETVSETHETVETVSETHEEEAVDEQAHRRRERAEAATERFIDSVSTSSLLSVKTPTRMLRSMAREDAEARTGKPQFEIRADLIDTASKLCSLKGIPFLYPLLEADWLIAAIAQEMSSLPVYVVTDDTDLLAANIGNASVLRSISLVSATKRVGGGAFEMVKPKEMWETVGLSLPIQRAYLATILGCDYCSGVRGIGPKSVLRLFFPWRSRWTKGVVKKADTRWNALVLYMRDYMDSIEDMSVFSHDELSLGLKAEARECCSLFSFHPSALDGLTVEEIEECRGDEEWCVPTRCIERYLRESHAREYSREAFSSSVSALMAGPSIEGYWLGSDIRSLDEETHVPDVSDDPCDDPEGEEGEEREDTGDGTGCDAAGASDSVSASVSLSTASPMLAPPHDEVCSFISSLNASAGSGAEQVMIGMASYVPELLSDRMKAARRDLGLDEAPPPTRTRRGRGTATSVSRKRDPLSPSRSSPLPDGSL